VREARINVNKQVRLAKRKYYNTRFESAKDIKTTYQIANKLMYRKASKAKPEHSSDTEIQM